jgi:hypothetical protein
MFKYLKKKEPWTETPIDLIRAQLTEWNFRNTWTTENTKYVYIMSTTVSVPSSELGDSHPLSRQRVCHSPPKSFIEVTICTSSNILVWFGRDTLEKSVAGLRESLISSPFEKFAKGLEKYGK